MKEFKLGEMVIYAPKDIKGNIYKFEIGIFKRYNDDKTRGFVYYSLGDTANCTNIDDLYKIENEYVFNKKDNILKFKFLDREEK